LERLTPLRRQNLSDNLALQLKKFIIAQNYESGNRLPTVAELAQRFAVGQPTIREAIKKLEAAGVVRVRHGSGMFVGELVHHLFLPNPVLSHEPPSKKMMLDLIEAKIPIEVQAIADAIDRIDDEGIQRLQDILDEAQNRSFDPERLYALNIEFHKEIARASGNYLIYQIIDVLSTIYREEQRFLINHFLSKEDDLKDHLRMLEAIRKKDKEQASQMMRRHLEEFRNSIKHWDPVLFSSEVSYEPV